ncbi:MAG: hypothetical protein GAK32_02340 [Pseudomonas fluorescens]|nr:MAG: hypothetical protein GAK32_02340 [Pseudomonas fluorescens]
MTQIVDGIQHATQHFPALVQMVQISPGEVLAGVAIAGGIQRRIIMAMERVTDLQHACIDEQMPIAGITGWHHAIEHVHTAANTLYEIFRFANAHKVTRFVSGHQARQVIQHLDHFMLGLAHRQTADGQAVEADLVQPLQRALAQAFMHPALHNAKQRGAVVGVGVLGTLGPTQRELHRHPRHVFIGRVRCALVKNHHDVGAQVTLNLHRLFRPHEHFGTVHRRSEGHAFFLDLAHGAQAEHLETAGVGEDGALPLHEVMQVAMLLDHLCARAQPQVEGVAQDDLGADVDNVTRQHALDGAIGAHRHECRGFHRAPRKGQAAATGLAVGGQQFKRHATHIVPSGPASLGAVGAGLRVMNIASP